jgi:ribulose-phosphate 3-epimerase
MLDEVGSAADLEVDGGVTTSNAQEVAGAGATVLVAGSAVYRHAGGAAEGVRALREASRI